MTNTPHNPTGANWTAADLRELAALVEKTGIYVIADEVYEHLVYDNAQHQSVLRNDVLYERSFAVFSFGKTYHATGWKTGYCVAPPALTTELRKVHQFVTFVAVAPIQYALADYMESHPEHYHELDRFYQAKRDLFCERLRDSRFTFTPAAGTYFQLLDYREIRDVADRAMVDLLLDDCGIAAIPISVFCESEPETRVLRLCFAKKDDTLIRAAEILCGI